MQTNFIKKIGEFFTQYVAHHATDTAVETVVGSATAEAAKVLKSKFGGLGPIDEFLTIEAAAIAQIEMGVEPKDISRIFKLFSTLSREQRNKVTNIIGLKDTQTIKVEEEKKTETKKDKKENQKEERSGKAEQKKTEKTKEEKTPVTPPQVETKNIRGAKIIKLLSGMTNAQIKNFLKGSGALDTFSSNVSEMWKTVKKGLEEITTSTGVITTLNTWAGDEKGGNLKEIMKKQREDQEEGKVTKWLKKKIYGRKEDN